MNDRTLTLPPNEYLDRLVAKARELNVKMEKSEIYELWFYYPPERAIAVWEPDLAQMPLSFVLTLFAHELGHVMDFDAHPALAAQTRHLHYSEVPLEIEVTGFVNGYRILQELAIPLSLDEYLWYIEQPLAAEVRRRLLAEFDETAAFGTLVS
ncbi:MAG: hypothetical protein ACM3RP_06410 [Chitinophagales bacterium]